jgi:hypothetical protein
MPSAREPRQPRRSPPLALGLATCVVALAVADRSRADDGAAAPDPGRSRAAVRTLEEAPSDQFLPPDVLATPLTKDDARGAQDLLWDRHVAAIRRDRADEFRTRRLRIGDLEMPFAFKVFGEKPERGRGLYLSLHGGGGAPARVNDQQYENQKGLYKPAEGIYLAPRAPTNNWNLWHEAHIDRFFDRLIEDLIAFEGVDPDRVYVLGYSAGGDGVYQIAPRMADRWAAAAMMAGHPNDASPLGLRNVPFALFVGGNDAAYKRNQVAREWGDKLDQLRKDDPGGYEHLVEVVAGKGHWMDREDAKAIPWMARFRRDGRPTHLVWHQDDVTRDRSYWLAVEPGRAVKGSTVLADRDGQEIRIEARGGADRILVRLDDRMLDLDRPVRVMSGGKILFEGRVPRTIATLRATLDGLGDPGLVFPAEVALTIAPPDPESQ